MGAGRSSAPISTSEMPSGDGPSSRPGTVTWISRRSSALSIASGTRVRSQSNGRTRAWIGSGARMTLWPSFEGPTSRNPTLPLTRRSSGIESDGQTKAGRLRHHGGRRGRKKIKEIGVGMLGYAFVGKAHSNAYRKIAYMTWPPPLMPKLELVAGRNEDAVREAAERYGYRRWTTDWHELVADPAVGLFDNGGPDPVHAEP